MNHSPYQFSSRRHLFLILFAGAWFTPTTALAKPQVRNEAKEIQTDHAEYIMLPGVFRAPETGFGAGIALFILSPMPSGKRGSQADATKIGAIYTEKRQFVMRGLVERFLNNHRDHVSVAGNVQKYPDSFFGIGNNTNIQDEETYTSYGWDAQIRYLREVNPVIYLGAQGAIYCERITDVKADGFLSHRTDQNGNPIYGTKPMQHFGMGILARLDTRDDLQDPVHGNYVEIGTLTRQRQLGSDFDFNSIYFDARGFIPFTNTAHPLRLAWQAVVTSHEGKIPFQALAPLGGRDLLRGYFLGRYRDRKLAALQFELRLPTSEKWGAVLYTGAGNVAPTWDKMTFASSKPAGGAGVRYRISDAQKVNLRLDFAWEVKTPNPSVYLSLAEAF